MHSKCWEKSFAEFFFWIRHSIYFLDVGVSFPGLLCVTFFNHNCQICMYVCRKFLCRKVQKKVNSHFLLPSILGCVKQSDKHARKCKNCSLRDLGKNWGNTLPLTKLNFQGFFQKCERKFSWLLTNSFLYFCIFWTPRVQTSK